MNAARSGHPQSDPARMRRYTGFVFDEAGQIIKVDATADHRFVAHRPRR